MLKTVAGLYTGVTSSRAGTKWEMCSKNRESMGLWKIHISPGSSHNKEHLVLWQIKAWTNVHEVVWTLDLYLFLSSIYFFHPIILGAEFKSHLSWISCSLSPNCFLIKKTIIFRYYLLLRPLRTIFSQYSLILSFFFSPCLFSDFLVSIRNAWVEICKRAQKGSEGTKCPLFSPMDCPLTLNIRLTFSTISSFPWSLALRFNCSVCYWSLSDWKLAQRMLFYLCVYFCLGADY